MNIADKPLGISAAIVSLEQGQCTPVCAAGYMQGHLGWSTVHIQSCWVLQRFAARPVKAQNDQK